MWSLSDGERKAGNVNGEVAAPGWFCDDTHAWPYTQQEPRRTVSEWEDDGGPSFDDDGRRAARDGGQNEAVRFGAAV